MKSLSNDRTQKILTLTANGLLAPQIATLLGISAATVHYRIGKRVFFTKERLSLWIEDMEQESSKSKKRS